jgi:RimJ/RimL family protein N-acetyltransferase
MPIDLITITPQQVTPEILSLFDLTKPTMARAFNVLEGLNRGQILVDDPAHPTTAVVRDVIYGTLYFGGNVNPGLVTALVRHFREIGEVGIGCWPYDPLNEMIPGNFDYDGRTYFFTERSAPHQAHSYKLPAGYQLVLRDEYWFRKSFDYESTMDAFGTIENVLRYTLGIVILHDEMVVCEAATGAPTHGWIELGVTTAEAYRGRGFASIACARLIEMCEAQGYKTWWDCARQNTPSVRLAKKLGYQGEPKYRYVWWPKNVTEVLTSSPDR